MGPEYRTLVHDGGLVDLEAVNFPPSSVQISSMPFQTPTVPVPSFLERLGHGLLVDDQVGNHFFHTAHPLLELLVLLGHGLPLKGQIVSLDYNAQRTRPANLGLLLLEHGPHPFYQDCRVPRRPCGRVHWNIIVRP